MRKNIFLLLGIVSYCLSAQNNVFLSNDYWKTKPTTDQVKQKIAEGNDPIALNERAYDATSLAINNGTPNETILYLLSLKGNEVDKLTHDKRTYLFWAVFSDNLPIAEHLLKSGAKIDVRDSHQYTPILFAAVRGNTNSKMYDLLLKNGASIKDVNENGANALLLLLPHLKNIKEAEYFTKKGLSLKAVDFNGEDALFYVARNGNKEIVSQLMSKGLSPKTKNNKGQNLFFAAAQGSRMKMNDLDFFKYLESLGVNPNEKDKEGLTPLYTLSLRHKDISVFNYFITKGNDVNQADNQGNTPLMNVSFKATPELVALLLSKTKDINAKNKQGNSALTQAVRGNSSEVLSYLLKNGADLKIVDKEGNTLSYYLLESYHPRDIDNFNKKWSVLQEKGLDFTQNQSGNNNLYHLAVTKENVELLSKITSVKIDINAKNAEGLTPLHKAVMIAKNLDLVRFLIDNGANKGIETDFGESVYELAKENEALKGMDINFLK